MEYVGILTVKKAYGDVLRKDGNLIKAEAIGTSDEECPVFEGYAVHPEDEPSTDSINRVFEEISVDLTALLNELGSAAARYRMLMETADACMRNADEELKRQESLISKIRGSAQEEK